MMVVFVEESNAIRDIASDNDDEVLTTTPPAVALVPIAAPDPATPLDLADAEDEQSATEAKGIRVVMP
jgi:hypothetical protein